MRFGEYDKKMSEEEKDLLYNLGIMDKCEELNNSNFTEIACFCHIHTDKLFLSFAALKDKGLIDYKEASKTIKNVRFTEQGRYVLKDMKLFQTQNQGFIKKQTLNDAIKIVKQGGV